MSLVRFEIERVSVEVEVGHATRTWTSRTAFHVRCIDDGLEGEGEVVPLPGYGVSTLDAVARALDAFAGRALPLDDVLPSLDACLPEARFALSTAYFDLCAKQRCLPLHASLGSIAPAPVPLSMLVPIHTHDAMARVLDEAAELGVHCFKVKMGGAPRDELRMLEALRRLAPEASLRVDANGAFQAAEVGAILAALAGLGVEYVEEPVPLYTLDALPSWPVPLALDESLPRLSDEALARWLDGGVLGALVLKPALLGGVDRALALASRAAACGVGASASHLFDGPIGLAAAAELALALPRPLAAGVAPHAGLGAFTPRTIAALGPASLHTHRSPGLGLGASA